MTVKHSKQLIAGIAASLLVGLGVAATLWTLTKIVDAAALRAANVATLTTGADLLSSFQGADADQRGMESVRAELASFIQILAGALAHQDTVLQSSLRQILTLVAVTTLLALLFAIALTRSIRRPEPGRLAATARPVTPRPASPPARTQEDPAEAARQSIPTTHT